MRQRRHGVRLLRRTAFRHNHPDPALCRLPLGDVHEHSQPNGVRHVRYAWSQQRERSAVKNRGYRMQGMRRWKDRRSIPVELRRYNGVEQELLARPEDHGCHCVRKLRAWALRRRQLACRVHAVCLRTVRQHDRPIGVRRVPRKPRQLHRSAHRRPDTRGCHLLCVPTWKDSR